MDIDSDQEGPERQSSSSSTYDIDMDGTKSTLTSTRAYLRLPSDTWAYTRYWVNKLVAEVNEQDAQLRSVTIVYDGTKFDADEDSSDTDVEEEEEEGPEQEQSRKPTKRMAERLASLMRSLAAKLLPSIRKLKLIFDGVEKALDDATWRALLLPLQLVPRDLEDCTVAVEVDDGLAPTVESLSWAIHGLTVDELRLSYDHESPGLLVLPRGVRELRLLPVERPGADGTIPTLHHFLAELAWDPTRDIITTERFSWGPFAASVDTPDLIAASLAVSQHGQEPGVPTKTLFSNPADRMPLLKQFILQIDIRISRPDSTTPALGSPYIAPRDLTWHFPTLRHLAMPAAFFPWFTHRTCSSAAGFRGPLPGLRSWDGYGSDPTSDRYPQLRYLFDEEGSDGELHATVTVSGDGTAQHQRAEADGGHIESGGMRPLEVCVGPNTDALAALVRHGNAASITFLRPNPESITGSALRLLRSTYRLRDPRAALPYWPVRYVATFPGNRERESLSPLDRVQMAFLLFDWPDEALRAAMSTLCFFWASRVLVIVVQDAAGENDESEGDAPESEYSERAEQEERALRRQLANDVPQVAVEYRKAVLADVAASSRFQTMGYEVGDEPRTGLSADGNRDWDETKPPDVTIVRVGRSAGLRRQLQDGAAAARYDRHPAVDRWEEPKIRGGQPKGVAGELVRAWYRA